MRVVVFIEELCLQGKLNRVEIDGTEHFIRITQVRKNGSFVIVFKIFDTNRDRASEGEYHISLPSQSPIIGQEYNINTGGHK